VGAPEAVRTTKLLLQQSPCSDKTRANAMTKSILDVQKGLAHLQASANTISSPDIHCPRLCPKFVPSKEACPRLKKTTALHNEAKETQK